MMTWALILVLHAGLLPNGFYSSYRQGVTSQQVVGFVTESACEAQAKKLALEQKAVVNAAFCVKVD